MQTIRTGPRWGSIKTAVNEGPWSRSGLYVLAGTNRGLFRKNGRNTIVDLWLLDDLAADLPEARIRPRPADLRKQAKVV